MVKKIDPTNINQEIHTNKTRDHRRKMSKKSKASKEVAHPKRRGRRPKKILEDIDMIPDEVPQETVSESKDNSAVILRLNINPKRLKKTANSKKTINTKKTVNAKKIGKQDKIQTIENSDSSSEGIFKNDIPADSTCPRCAKNEKAVTLLKSKLEKYEKKDKIDKANKIYINKLKFISYNTKKKITITKTNNKCWWDANKFTNLPCFLPELFHNNVYHVTGCFCSFNCALAYNLYYLKDSKIHQRKSLIF